MRKVILCILVLLTTACNDADTGLPKSTGRPSEVLLVGDVDSIVAKALTADIVALPQPEPMFDVKANGKANIKENGKTNVKTNGKTNGKRSNGSDAQVALNAVSRMERNIVVVNIDPTLFTRTAVRYERNVFAAPQIIVYVNTPSAQALKSDIGRCHIDRLLLQNELTAHAERLKRHHEKGVEDDIKRMFGCSMTIPKGMRVNVRGQQFVWISDNNPTKMSNICLYTSENRDSVMRINLKGETDSMFMTTVGGKRRYNHRHLTRQHEHHAATRTVADARRRHGGTVHVENHTHASQQDHRGRGFRLCTRRTKKRHHETVGGKRANIETAAEDHETKIKKTSSFLWKTEK